jgi:hypothetical protein
MSQRTKVEFMSRVRMHLRRRGRRWEAWADPFSVGGEGDSIDEAVEDAKRGVERLFSALAEALHEHGGRVEVLCPLEESLKSRKYRDFQVYAVRRVRSAPDVTPPARDLTRTRLRRALRDADRVGLTPSPAGA